jgi:undecaprenyl diphosphate synthase
MVVGGTLRAWAELGDQRWADRAVRLGAVVADAGGRWLTLRAYETGTDPVELPRWQTTVGSCEVIVDPCADGRLRFAEAMNRMPPGQVVTEETVADVLYAPADVEPDLVLVLGPPDRLPPSLVWELAYCELVFCPLAWDELDDMHLIEAIDAFAGRRRRFGGLDG